ncbi:hypothetical protein SteCoe_27645 [Stentor coeruleus]|uniref:PH domain-containing protein n=1 Tax=Stentor coeruleus TaxID=5963 RepID=A0A1R2BA25_9CILI|nr:hypothetical protein SteCoe_27645 [Stentor coeruleus]
MSKFERRIHHRPLICNSSSYLGTIAFKDTPDAQNRRYLWIDYTTKEMRWSVGTVPHNPCKRISLSCIQSVTKVVSSPHIGFKLQSKSHTLVFWLYNEKEANAWISELSNLISPDENVKAKKSRTVSPFECELSEMQSLKFKVMKILNSYIPALQVQSIEEVPEILKNYLDSLVCEKKEETIPEEVKPLKEQINLLQNKIKSLEEVKAEYDKYSLLEEEFTSLKAIGSELGAKFDKIQAEKALLCRDARLMRNELSSINIQNKQSQKQLKKSSLLSGLVSLNNSPRFLTLISDINTLFLYTPCEFSISSEKFLYSMISHMHITESKQLSLCLVNNFTMTLDGESNILESILESYNRYLALESNPNEKALAQYAAICEESDRQLRAFEKQVKCYKQIMTVIYK